MAYESWQWIFFGIAAIIIGMSKCGIPGLGILNVAIFQNVLLAKDATGFGLPLLVVGDLCAVIAFRRHAEWTQVMSLVPWAAVTVALFAAGVWVVLQPMQMRGTMQLAGAP